MSSGCNWNYSPGSPCGDSRSWRYPRRLAACLEDALVVAKPIQEELEVLQDPFCVLSSLSVPLLYKLRALVRLDRPCLLHPGTLKTTARQGRPLNHPQPLSIKIGRAWVSLLKGLPQPHIVGGTTSQVSVLASGDRSEDTH